MTVLQKHALPEEAALAIPRIEPDPRAVSTALLMQKTVDQ